MAKLSPKDLNFFWSKRVFLFDLDGTLYLGKKLIPGALQLIDKLTKAKKEIFYFTNNSSRSDLDYVRKLKAFGFPCKKSQIVMSTHSFIRALQKDRVTKLYMLGTPSMKKMLSHAGILSVSEGAQAVGVGFDKTLTYQKLEKASFLIHKGLPYYVAHPDFFCPTEKGPEPDCGGIALMLEKATKRKPKAVLGKPHPSMILEVQQRIRCKKSEMLLIGDRLMTDHQMAKSAGIESVFVLSGDSNLRDLKDSGIRPRLIVPSVRSFI